MSDLLQRIQHPVLMAIVFALSIVLFVLALVGVPWIVVRLPVDYFAAPRRPHLLAEGTPLRFGVAAVKNLLGILVLLAGVAMLILPGQGLLTILVGLGLLDFPGKWRLERRLVSLRPVLWTINRIRQRAGRAPLQIDPMDTDG